MCDARPRPRSGRWRPTGGSAGIAIVMVLAAACAGPAAPAGSGATTSSATAGPSPAPSADGPVVTAFQLIDDIGCSGSPVSVPTSWATRNTQTVQFQVDGQPPGPARATNGIGDVAVPCDGRTHQVALLATGAAGRASVLRQVNTSTGPPPATAPSITGFDLLDDVTCTGNPIDVSASWVTRNAQAVNFSVDGQPLPAAAGFPVTGAGNVPVPCDGSSHKVTLTATGTGPAASLSRSVNTSNGPPPPPVSGPVITAFQIIDDPGCAGSSVAVPVAWATRGVQTVGFQVDGQPVSAGAGYPVNGVGTVPVPCDGKAHPVVLVASGNGTQVSATRQVNTSTGPPPATAPSITRFDVLDDAPCTGGTVDVAAGWATQNAQAVNFAVDGQPLSAAAGFPVTGLGRIAVPCDGKAHTVTLTATGSGPAASLSRSVNTSTS